MAKLSGAAKTGIACVAIWVLGLAWMYLDFRFGSHVWTITPGPILMMLTMAVAAPVALVCAVIVLMRGPWRADAASAQSPAVDVDP